ncbi:ogr/Delta-like zinc finger family protein [Pantoea dispersa]|uniref:ogr/Delta-like zinc finger family protein n=1 Tax=Pantoea dispersa TaxID=59814 RepID=UPI0039BDC625
MFTCPKCNAAARTRTSLMLSKETRRSYHQCTNMLCGQSFTTLETVENYLNNVTPSAKAHIIPANVFPKSNYGENQLSLKL